MHFLREQEGFTLIELMVVMSISAILLGYSAMHLQELTRPAESAAGQVGSFFKAARAKALSTTSAYTVRPDGAGALVAEASTTCGATTALDSKLSLELPSFVLFTSVGWSVCFDSRGFPDTNLLVEVEDDFGERHSIEVFLGGGVRVQ